MIYGLLRGSSTLPFVYGFDRAWYQWSPQGKTVVDNDVLILFLNSTNFKEIPEEEARKRIVKMRLR